MNIERDDLPILPPIFVEYLEQIYNTDMMLKTHTRNNDELVGYMRGVRDVLAHVRFLSKED